MPSIIRFEARYIGHPDVAIDVECDRVDYYPAEWATQTGADGGVMRSMSASAYLLAFGLPVIDLSPGWTHVSWVDGEWHQLRALDQDAKPTRLTI